MTTRFSITYDYLCPFARIANELIIEAIDDGADLDVRFTPFSLSQNSLGDNEPSVWFTDPNDAVAKGVLAILWSIAVRDGQSERFPAFHLALFAARHDDGVDINDPGELRRIAASVGVDVDAAWADIESGVSAKTLDNEHTAHVEDHGVFGVPTFISGREAVFVRFMERHKRSDLDQVLAMLDDPTINEFKRTRIPR